MKLKNLIIASILSVSVASANSDVMQKSMSLMAKGMNSIQTGFMHNNVESIREGVKLIEKGNALFSDKDVISKYLPKEKQHLINVAANQAKRISLDLSVLNLRLDEKEYINAANAYSDILNACSRCHSIVRKW